MLKDIAKDYYFNHNYNCAECILHSANDYYELGLHDRDMLMVASQGAGFQCGEMCGALNVAGCVLSLLFVKERAHEGNIIQKVNVSMVKRFKEELGGVYCRDLRKIHFNKEERCLYTVEKACDALEAVVEEFKEYRVR